MEPTEPATRERRIHHIIHTTTTTELSIISGATHFYYYHRHTERIIKVYRVVPRVVTVRVFYLQDILRSEAEKLKNLFSNPPTSDTNRFVRLNPKLFSSETVDPSLIELHTFDDLVALMDVDDPGSLPHSDVIVILGHSNVFNFGPLNISHILGTLVDPNRPPSFVAFLGCCGGNPRYGPLKKLSLLPEFQSTVFGYFQRRIYTDELFHTIPVLAIQYYLHLEIHVHTLAITKKLLLVYSIYCAYLDSRYNYECDASRFLNSKYELSLAQEFLSVIQAIATTDNIPLSCWQLAMYHDYIIEHNRGKKMREFIATVKEEKMSIEKVNEICKTKLKNEKLYKIIRLACELQLLKVTKETFDLLRKNEWKKVDHLQFFVAMLQGFWGKNSYDDLIEYATYHLMEELLSNQNKKYLCKYQLCCVGYCLFSPNTCIKIISDDTKELYIIWKSEVSFEITCEIYKEIKFPSDELCYFSMPAAEFKKLKVKKTLESLVKSDPHKKNHYINGAFECVVTDKGYQVVSNDHITKLPCLSQLTALSTGKNIEELPWVDMFAIRRKDNKFVKLYDGGNTGTEYFSMHSWCKHECTVCHTKAKSKLAKCEYRYTQTDLLKALEALKDNFFPSQDALKLKENQRLYYFYDVKKFCNKDNKERGYMKCFPDDIYYCELRVIHDSGNLSKVDNMDKLMKTHVQNWKKVSRCRFIFAYTDISDEEKRGTLYYTDSHYGEDKIPKETLVKKMCFHMFEQFSKNKKKCKTQKESMDRVENILKLLLNNSTDMDCSQKLEALYTKILPKTLKEELYEEQKNLSEQLKTNMNEMSYYQIFKMLTENLKSKTKSRKLREDHQEVQEILKQIRNFNIKWDCFKLLNFLVEKILPAFKNDLHKEQRILLKDEEDFKDIDYFKLFKEVTEKKWAYKYNLLEELLGQMHKELVEALKSEIEYNLRVTLNDKTKLQTLLTSTTDQLKYFTGILKQSVKYFIEELEKKSLSELLHRETLEEQFDETLKSFQTLQLSNDKHVRVKMIQDSFERVIKYNVVEEFYPFVEIGELSIKKDGKPVLTWLEE